MIKLPLMKTFIIMITIMSNLLALSFMNLFNMWFMLEISSMSMISLLMVDKSKKASIMYFIISFISSSILVLSISMFKMDHYNNNWLMIMIIMSLTLKMGMLPLNKWMINMSNNLNWKNMFILLMFMKIIPMYMFYSFFDSMNLIIMMLLMLNMIISPIMAMNLNSLKKIMIYSSINQSSLMIITMFISMNLFIMYFLIYLISSLMLFSILYNMNISNKYMMINLIFSKKMKFMYLILVVIYSNLPPMITFIMKWSILENLLIYNPTLILMNMMIMMSGTIMTWNYLNLNNMNMYMFNSNMNFKINNKFKHHNMLYMINFMLTMLFLLFSYLSY